MKISCQSCQAKYTIADDKVRGKVVKIRCKKCGTTIVVNGNELEAAAAAPAAQPEQDEATRVYDAGQHATAGEEWTVAVSDGDQRTLSTAALVELYQAGTVTAETYAWKDGMTDWLPLAEIEPLKGLLPRAGGGASALPSYDQPAPSAAAQFPSAPPPEPEPAPQPQPVAAAPVVAASPRPLTGARAAAGGGMFGAAEQSSSGGAAAARRQGGRGASADLFGAAAAAGSDDDVMTSASANPQVSDSPERLTGARNENSVLFSLSALSATGAPATPSAGAAVPGPAMGGVAAEASGIIDIKNLMGAVGAGNGSKPKSKVDDIMNLGGGGVFAPSLAAPILAPPAADFGPPPDANQSSKQAQNKGLLMGLGAGGALVLVAGLVFVLMGGSKQAEPATAGSAQAAASAAAAPGLGAMPAGSGVAANAGAAAADTAAAAGTGASDNAAAPAAPAAAAPAAVAPGAAPVAAKPAEERPKPAAPAAAPAAAPGPAIPKPAAEKPAAAPAAAAPAAGGADFNRSAALSALTAAAGAAQSCKKADGPTGAGRIAVTFAPSGNVTTANVEGPPFAGTPVGGCVAARFRGAHVPPFGGGTITVHKSFSIN